MVKRFFKKSDFWAVMFGVVMVFIIFGDGTPIPYVGNLDSAFGQIFWPYTDVIYPIASIVFFLLYGRTKGSIKINPASIWPFIVFLAAAVMIQIDDFFPVFGHTITLPDTYWTVARWLYFFIATSMFLAFGSACKKNKEHRNQ